MAQPLGAHTAKAYSRFRLWAAVSALAVVLVIVAGGIVRSTGSGMGCPEWPKCFGGWVPPTEVSQLPPDYRQRFDLYGHGVDEFNVYKTWTEYLNRLLGALTGLILLGTMVYGWLRRLDKPQDSRLSLWAFTAATFGIAVQGWLGAKVVSANLAGYMVTLHMALALIILFLLLAAVWPRIQAPNTPLPPYLKTLALFGLILTFVQVALGTQVREAVDGYLETDTPVSREAVIDLVGIIFLVHRSYSLTILALNAYIGFQLQRAGLLTSLQGRWHLLGWGILLLTIPTGMVLAYLGLPHWAQPIHLTGGSLLAAQQFMQYRAFRAALHEPTLTEKLPLQPA